MSLFPSSCGSSGGSGGTGDNGSTGGSGGSGGSGSTGGSGGHLGLLRCVLFHIVSEEDGCLLQTLQASSLIWSHSKPVLVH